MNTEEVVHYYEKNRPCVPENIARRQVRIENKDGKFIILNRQVHKAERLQNILIKLQPKNVYVSCAQWLNPVNVRHKKSIRGYVIADNILLDCDVFVDIDKDSPQDVLKTIEFFKVKSEYKLQHIIRSGGGYHIIYKETNLSKELGPIHPEKRIEFVKNKRMKLESALIKFGVDLDRGIMQDVMRIRRCPGTLNGNKGYVECKEVDITILESLTAMTTREGSPSSDNQKVARPRISAPLFYSYKFISNMVSGISNGYVPYLEIEKHTNYTKLIRTLQRTYNIGTCYVFELPTCRGVLSLKINSKRRVEKIMKAAKALNLNQFMKYSHVWIKTSSMRSGNEEFKVKLIDVIPGSAKGQFSKPHKEFIQSLDRGNNSSVTTFEVIEPTSSNDTYVGNERNKVHVCVASAEHS